MNCSVYTMQIIIPKWAYKIVELEDGTYLVIIDEAFLSSLRCPHCNEPLFKSGFYQRHIIKTDGEDIVLKLNRLECRNEHCKYKKAHNLQQAPKFKVTTNYYVRNFVKKEPDLQSARSELCA